jgi:hypothetical protein
MVIDRLPELLLREARGPTELDKPRPDCYKLGTESGAFCTNWRVPVTLETAATW